MRIEGETPGETLREAWVALTPSEARELRDALDDLLEGVGNDWHAHVASEDGTVELTSALRLRHNCRSARFRTGNLCEC